MPKGSVDPARLLGRPRQFTLLRRFSFLSHSHNIPGRFEFSRGFWVRPPPQHRGRPRE